MKGNPAVLEVLNDALRHELTAVNQYWLHYRMLDNWGFKKLAKHEREESIEEMQHADKLVERILFLEGHPNLQRLDPLKIGENLEEIIKCDLAAEVSARALYLKARGICRQAEDLGTMQLFEQLIVDEEGHIDFLETQLDLISKIGIENYGLLQSSPANESEDK